MDKKEYKIISIISSDAEIIIEELSSLEDAINRLRELEDTNDGYMEMKSYALITSGDIIDHNIKNLNKF